MLTRSKLVVLEWCLEQYMKSATPMPIDVKCHQSPSSGFLSSRFPTLGLCRQKVLSFPVGCLPQVEDSIAFIYFWLFLYISACASATE